MKKIYSYLFIFTLLSTLFIVESCTKDKPFDEVEAIVANPKIAYLVNVEITDANVAATNPYPANTIITLSGDAVDKGLIYNGAGDALTTASGSAKVQNNTLSLLVKQDVVISESYPLTFTVKAEADKFLSNSKEITITSIDSLQFINLTLLKIASLPTGVALTSTGTVATAGKIQNDFEVDVNSKLDGSSATEKVVTAIFPKEIVFLDKTGTAITGAGDFKIVATNFSASTEGSVESIPGGTTGTTSTGEKVSFVVAGAVNINASIGGADIKSFSTPVPFTVRLSSGVFNPSTKTNLKAGDQLPVWSKDEGSAIWKNEGSAVVTTDGAGNLKTTMSVSHLSTWMVGYNLAFCTNATTFNYVSSSATSIPTYTVVKIVGGNGQPVHTRVSTLKNGDKISFTLPVGVSFTVNTYAGIAATGTPFSSIAVGACAASATITNSVVSTNPTLAFDLQTKCQNGTFRYSGAIFYKVSGTAQWIPFTSSVDGKLSTNLLAWDASYTFKASYKGVDYIRTRKVLQAEFRQSGTVYNFFGNTSTQQTFFSAPTACN